MLLYETAMDLLQKWRTAIAHSRGCKPRHIFETSALEHICRRMPGDIETLEGVQGVSKAKSRWYGQRVLELLRAAEQHVEVRRPTVRSGPGRDL